jgi:predicted dehydrogenase
MNSYVESPQAELVAVADVDEVRGKEAGEKFGVPNVFSDFNEMLDMPDLEAVSICLPNSLHAPASIAGLKAGKHVLCEKPLTIDVASAVEMLETSRKTGKRLAMSLNFRHGGNARMLKAAADSGELGEIYHGKGGMLRDDAIPRGWFHRKKYSGGGPLLDLAPHILDVTWWIMGKPKPVAASGVTYAKFGPRGLGMGGWGVGWEEGPFDVEDFAMGMIRFENGETLFTEVSWALNYQPITYSYVCGTEGGASLHPDLDAFKTDGSPIEMDPLPDEDPPTRFISDLLAERPALGPIEDGVVVMKMLEGIYRSAEKGEEVKIN